MPNWCSNNISIIGNDEAKIKNLYQLLKNWTSKVSEPNSWGEKWLGNIVNFSGIDKDVSCRGCIEGLDLYKNTISFWTETAWAPALKMWVLVCNKYLGDEDVNWNIYYTSEEPGEGLFCSNDPDIIDSYTIEVWEDNDWLADSEYEVPDTRVVELLKEVFNTEETNIEVLLERLNDMDEPPFYIHKIDYVSLYDWE